MCHGPANIRRNPHRVLRFHASKDAFSGQQSLDPSSERGIILRLREHILYNGSGSYTTFTMFIMFILQRSRLA